MSSISSAFAALTLAVSASALSIEDKVISISAHENQAVIQDAETKALKIIKQGDAYPDSQHQIKTLLKERIEIVNVETGESEWISKATELTDSNNSDVLLVKVENAEKVSADISWLARIKIYLSALWQKILGWWVSI